MHCTNVQKNLYNCCHQMSSFKAKMHQIRFRLGLQTPLRELTALPKAPQLVWWCLLLRRERGSEGREGARRGRKRENHYKRHGKGESAGWEGKKGEGKRREERKGKRGGREGEVCSRNFQLFQALFYAPPCTMYLNKKGPLCHASPFYWDTA